MNNKLLRSTLAALVLSITASTAFGAGWDNDLRTRCASTTTTPGGYYYSETAQCSGAGGHHWLLGVQSESSLSASCPGPTTRSYEINGWNSPVRLGWASHTSDVGPNWSVNMVVDQSTYPPNPGCGSPVWTWFSFQDNKGNGGAASLPSPFTVASSHVINYTHWEPSANDGTRLIAGAQFFWNGVAHTIEINLTHANYGYSPSHPPGLLLSQPLPGGEEFIILDGPYWGVTVTPGVDTPVYIPWYYLLQESANRGWLTQPPLNAETGAIHLAVEVKDRAIANLWHTNFRIGG